MDPREHLVTAVKRWARISAYDWANMLWGYSGIVNLVPAYKALTEKNFNLNLIKTDEELRPEPTSAELCLRICYA